MNNCQGKRNETYPGSAFPNRPGVKSIEIAGSLICAQCGEEISDNSIKPRMEWDLVLLVWGVMRKRLDINNTDCKRQWRKCFCMS